jgi:hypothetical protein
MPHLYEVVSVLLRLSGVRNWRNPPTPVDPQEV